MPDPMWRRIAEDLREKIESGDIGSDGTPLPSELELRDQYDASRNTVRDAVKWLVTRGLVVTRPGQGTFVVKRIRPYVTVLRPELSAADPFGTVYRPEIDDDKASEPADRAPESTGERRKQQISLPRVEILQAEGAVARELRLADGATVVSRQQERSIDGTHWSLQTSFYPMALVQQGAVRLIQAEDISPGAVAYIGEALGIRQAGWRDRLVVRAPGQHETSFFGLPDNGRIAVFEFTRTGYDQERRPFRVTITTCPADRNQFILTAGEVPPGASGEHESH